MSTAQLSASLRRSSSVYVIGDAGLRRVGERARRAGRAQHESAQKQRSAFLVLIASVLPCVFVSSPAGVRPCLVHLYGADSTMACRLPWNTPWMSASTSRRSDPRTRPVQAYRAALDMRYLGDLYGEGGLFYQDIAQQQDLRQDAHDEEDGDYRARPRQVPMDEMVLSEVMRPIMRPPRPAWRRR